MNMWPTVGFLTGTPGGGELILVFVAILLLFGPKQLPKIAKTIGRMMEELRRASQDFRDQVMGLDEPPSIETPCEDVTTVEEGREAREERDMSASPRDDGLPPESGEKEGRDERAG